MSINKKSNITLALILLGYGLMFLIIVLGVIFPGEPSPNQAPWFVWAAVGEVTAFAITTLVTCFIVRKKGQEKERFE